MRVHLGLLQDLVADLRGNICWFCHPIPALSDFCLSLSSASEAKAICGPNEVGCVWFRLEAKAMSVCMQGEGGNPTALASLQIKTKIMDSEVIPPNDSQSQLLG